MICKDVGYNKESGGDWCVDRVGLVEGRASYDDAIDSLKEQASLGELEWSDALGAACREHVLDIGPKGMEGHVGSSGSTSYDRISKYADQFTMMSENIVFADSRFDAHGQGLEMMKVLIVDDGVGARGHRRNVMGTHYTHTGAACGCHTVYGQVCVIMYGMQVVPKPNVETFDIKKTPIEQCHFSETWSENLNGETKALEIYQSMTPQDLEDKEIQTLHTIEGDLEFDPNNIKLDNEGDYILVEEAQSDQTGDGVQSVDGTWYDGSAVGEDQIDVYDGVRGDPEFEANMQNYDTPTATASQGSFTGSSTNPQPTTLTYNE